MKLFRKVYSYTFNLIRQRLTRPQYIMLVATITALISRFVIFAGTIELNDIKKLLFGKEKHAGTSIAQLTKKPRDIIYIEESTLKVMHKFDTIQAWYLPVLDRDKKFAGFISKTRIFEKYREILCAQKDLYED